MLEQQGKMERAAPGGPREAEDVPAGYKRTGVGVIPEDWDVATLGGWARARGESTSTTRRTFWRRPTEQRYLRTAMKTYATAILPTLISCSRCRDRARSKANCMASQVSGVEPNAFDKR